MTGKYKISAAETMK